MRKGWLALALAAGLTGGLAGCEDATVITHVFKMPNITEGDLVAMQSHGGIPVEMHGLPFTGATPDAIAGAMKGPAGAAPIRFRAQEIVGPSFHGSRMVLHFNPSGPTNSQADCARTAEAATDPPADTGFRVTMTFCNGDQIEAHGFMKALETPAGDYEAYSRAMRQLMSTVFREEKDR